jgi:hypothetical protein
MSMDIQIVTVINNPTQYERYIKNNPFYKGMDLVSFDNTKENVPIPLRYNSFIDHRMLPDAWVIFCHQDFSIREDVALKFRDLDRECLYGPIGIKASRGGEFVFRIRGMRILKSRRSDFSYREIFGQYLQGFGGDESRAKLMGKKVGKPYEVDSVDSCCLIAHASLIKKYGLRFDEKFDYTLFADDFSIMAKKLYRIRTKALQLDCFHLSEGGKSVGYYRCLSYLIEKYPGEKIAVTSSEYKEIEAIRHLLMNKDTAKIAEYFVGWKGRS